MSSAIAHRAVIEVGPGVVRRLCCGTSTVSEEAGAAALRAIDDPVTLVNGSPVAVESLWRSVLWSLRCGGRAGVIVVHPSWWPASRVELISTAARTLSPDTDEVVLQPRSWLLRALSDFGSDFGSDLASDEIVVVEIADRLVAISAAEVVAVPRRTEPHPIAEEIAGVILRPAGLTRATPAVVLIDAPGTVSGAPELAASIAEAMRGAAAKVVRVEDARLPWLARLAGAVPANEPDEAQTEGGGRLRSRARTIAAVAAAGVAVAGLGLAVPARVPAKHQEVVRATTPTQVPTTFLVEGRISLTVPANWPTRRVIAGPGSARVQVTSPSDPEVALHVTQSLVVGETLAGAAERLKQAIDAAPAGVFVDFNPSGSSAGRPAVTYRELRAAHHVRWTVLLDGTVRISVGCQSRPGGADAVRDVCDQAVRSAHAV